MTSNSKKQFNVFVSSRLFPTQNPSYLNAIINPTIQLPDTNWEVALVGGSLVNSVANVSSSLGNNSLRYSVNAGVDYFTVTFPTGSYSTTGIQNQMITAMDTNGHYTVSGSGERVYPITFSVNLSLLRVTLKLNADCRVDFTVSTLYDLLGFNNQIYNGGTGTTFTASGIGKFTDRSVNYFIWCDAIQGGIQNDYFGQGVLRIVNGGDLGAGISLKPDSYEVDYFPVKSKNISKINFVVYDALGTQADFNGEQTSFQLKFRQL